MREGEFAAADIAHVVGDNHIRATRQGAYLPSKRQPAVYCPHPSGGICLATPRSLITRLKQCHSILTPYLLRAPGNDA